jgi:hypothetical protein
MLRLKQCVLPHPGVIPGARGHKKQIIPAGTQVWCIVYHNKYYWAVYQTEEQAQMCLSNLLAIVEGRARRFTPLDTLVAWNFSTTFPKRVVRIK